MVPAEGPALVTRLFAGALRGTGRLRTDKEERFEHMWSDMNTLCTNVGTRNSWTGYTWSSRELCFVNELCGGGCMSRDTQKRTLCMSTSWGGWQRVSFPYYPMPRLSGPHRAAAQKMKPGSSSRRRSAARWRAREMCSRPARSRCGCGHQCRTSNRTPAQITIWY